MLDDPIVTLTEAFQTTSLTVLLLVTVLVVLPVLATVTVQLPLGNVSDEVPVYGL